MFDRWPMKWVGRLLCAIVGATACACGPEPDSLRGMARQAKRQGKTAITFRHHEDERGAASHLDDLLRSESVVLATPADPASIQVTEKFYIYTWHVFRVLRVLAQPPPRSSLGCDAAPPRHLTEHEIAIPLGGGTAVVDDVSITMESNDSDVTFERGREYLFLATLCANGVTLLSQGGADVFGVTPDGHITAPAGIENQFFDTCKTCATSAHWTEWSSI